MMNLSTHEARFNLLQFKELCVRNAQLLNELGIEVDAFPIPSTTQFKSRPTPFREAALKALSIEILILESMLTEDAKRLDSATHLARFVSMMDYTAQPDIFEKIDDDDSVAIYMVDGSHQHQIFRNLKYLERTTFTIEQLCEMNWKHAYLHEIEFANDVIEAITHCMVSARPATIAFHPRKHVITELGSSKGRTFGITLKYLSPVTQDGKIKGFISTNTSRLLANHR